MTTTVKAAPLPGSGGGFTMGVWRAEDVPVGSDVGIVAASAPKVQMTDAEIHQIATEHGMYEQHDNARPSADTVEYFARAIAARSAPNADLVAALKKIRQSVPCLDAGGNFIVEHDPVEGVHGGGIEQIDPVQLVQYMDGVARAALAAVGEA